MAAGVTGAIALAGVGYLVANHRIHAGGTAGGAAGAAAGQFIYTERTANDAAITLPGAVQDDLLRIGQDDQPITVTKVGFAGRVTTSYIDMTPRTGNSSSDPVLKVGGRIVQAIDSKISVIEKTINSSPTNAIGGGRALFAGLTKINFTGAPVTIISSGLDLANPDNFRSLGWSVPPEEVAANVKRAGDLPALHGPVTFVIVPTAGQQPQLGQAQKDYIKAVWTALLKAAGATFVRFIDANGTTPSPVAPSAPTVAVPGPPHTPIPSVPEAPNKLTCTVPASYFIVNTPRLIDVAQTKLALTPCINAALAAHAGFALDGWTSYEGPLNANGQPAINYPVNRKLSNARVRTIAKLLVNRLGVPSSAITHMIGHGDFNQPFPHPGSRANRVVIITYTVK